MKPARLAFYALLLACIPFGPLAIYAKDFVAHNVQVSQPAMAAVSVGATTPEEQLFSQLHKQVSNNGTFLPKDYTVSRYFMYSKADIEEEGGEAGIRDMYSGRLMGGVSQFGGCHVECKDANGDGIMSFDDLTPEDKESCEKGVGNDRAQSQCKAGPADLNGDGFKGDFINAEHLWPKSAFGQKQELFGDLHNLRPSFSKPNALRGSSPFAPDGAGMWPQMKGDVARALFYFALTYYDRIPADKADQYFTQSVPVLMRWNHEDPPDEYEVKRTELVAQFQGNDNPFVKNPELIDRIGQKLWQNLFRH